MNKAIVLLALTTLLACAGAGSSAPQAGTPPANQGKGNIKITLTAGTPNAEERTAKSAALDTVQALPTPTNIRVLVTNPTNGFLGTQDVTIGTADAVDIPVPAVAGYKVEAISYLYGGGTYSNNIILKYIFQDGIDVSPDVETNVTLILQTLPSLFSLPSTVEAGSSFPISVTIPSFMNQVAFLNLSTTPITTGIPTSGDPQFTSPVWPSTTTFNAPTETVAGTFYCQAFAQLGSNWVLSTEPQSAFGYFMYAYPNPVYGDPDASMPYTLPNGGITLGIVY